jgi:hypothetical protein
LLVLEDKRKGDEMTPDEHLEDTREEPEYPEYTEYDEFLDAADYYYDTEGDR